MPVGRRYTAYRRVVEELGLRQLDVYRYKDHDELRLLTPSGEVKLVKLPRRRDEMTVEEFREFLRRELGL
ncbi:MAG: hypothetical protein GXO15_04490 [Crenarchaeota archaeon]|nr:hypothetical protein [Thermoproteota archaeon]